MRTDAYASNNNECWMIWQPSDSNANYVQLISATNSLFNNSSMYQMLGSSYPLSQAYNMYGMKQKDDTVPSITTEALDTSAKTDSFAQFFMSKDGTGTHDGKTLDKVLFTHAYSKKVLDCTEALSNSNSSPTLKSSSTASNYFYLLEPVFPFYDGLTSPTNIYLQTSTSGTSTKTLDWWTTSTHYWQWTDTVNTINAGDYHHYKERDYKLNNNGTVTYGEWTNWVDQYPSNWITSGQKRWMKNATTIPSCSTSIKATGKQVQMNTFRTVTAFEKSWVFQAPQGNVSATSIFAKKPTLTKDGLAWTPDGMKVNFTSDYFGQGSMKLRVTSVKSGNTEILSKGYETSIVQDSTVTIPTSYLKRPPKDGENLTLTIRLDTDVYAPQNYYVTINDTLTYDEGNVNVTPTITKLDGLKYKADVPYANTVRMWMSVDGVNTELTGTVSNGHTIFEFYPPFCTDWGLFTQYENSDKTKWGTDYTEMPRLNIRAHCFTWSGGSVVIWLNKDTALTESFTFSPQSTTHTLAGRSHDVVTYLSDGSKNYTSVTGDIKGYIVPQCETYGTTKESIEKMVEQGHVFYRAPYGRCCNVAVTGADITTDVGITEVSISIVQEDDD